MFSARLVGRLARFHGQRSETSSGRPSAVNQPATGQFPVASAIARIPSRGMFSTGLPSTQPAARPSQAPATRSRRSTGQGALAPGRPARGSRRSRRAPRRPADAASHRARRAARARSARSCGRDRLLRRAAARRRRATRRRASAARRVDVLPFLASLPELVSDEVLGLNPGDPQAGTSPAASAASAAARSWWRWASRSKISGRDDGHRAPRFLDVDLARGGDVVDPVAAERDCRERRRARRPSRRSSPSRGRN